MSNTHYFTTSEANKKIFVLVCDYYNKIITFSTLHNYVYCTCTIFRGVKLGIRLSKSEGQILVSVIGFRRTS